MPAPPKLRVLFVCIGNSCRSPMAESIVHREAIDVIEPTSAGLFPLGFIAELTIRTLQRNGCPTHGLSSKPVTPSLWNSADLVINMSGHEKQRAFSPSEKVVDWHVEDPYGADPAVYQRIFDEIAERVVDLAARLRIERRGFSAQGPGASEESR
ncbi:MAG TPA: low molecular weight phosphatase family protein [Terriglobales bacterium]|nr:low molecular weight phosphatase family protein [Terriglobales bacterium]